MWAVLTRGACVGTDSLPSPAGATTLASHDAGVRFAWCHAAGVAWQVYAVTCAAVQRLSGGCAACCLLLAVVASWSCPPRHGSMSHHEHGGRAESLGSTLSSKGNQSVVTALPHFISIYLADLHSMTISNAGIWHKVVLYCSARDAASGQGVPAESLGNPAGK